MKSPAPTPTPLVDLLAATALATVRWACDTYGDELSLLASMQDSVLIDLATQINPSIDVVFLDTGYHFDETHQTRRAIEHRYGIDVRVVGPTAEPAPFVEPGDCCASKPALLDQALRGRQAWLTGARRCETPHRARLEFIAQDARGMTKISPIAQWSDADTAAYVASREVITHPLLTKGYTSIGCAPCTTPADPEQPRSGRWRGTDRTECGIHL